MGKLWPDIDVEKTESVPKRLLNDAKKELEQLSKRKLTLIVRSKLSEELITLSASILARGAAFNYPLMDVEYKVVEQFPVKIVGGNPTRERIANDEGQLADAIKSILAEDETVAVVQRLMSIAGLR
jgi:hypothetical protein